jgi:heme a synthase
VARQAPLRSAVYDRWSAVNDRLRALSDRFLGALPREVDRRIRVFAWVALVTQLANVVSGAAVRLTGSGLGCPSFPECTPGSLVVTPEMGIHGLIEFGNRMVAVLLTLICVSVFLLVVRLRRSRPDLFWLAFSMALGIPAQALIGGMSVLSGLNPYVVGLHFVLSVVLIVLSTVLLYRVYGAPGSYRVAAEPAMWWATVAVCVTGTLAVLVGIVTTGAGPHAGDAAAPRNGLDPALLEHVHSYPAYAMLAASLVVLYLAWNASESTRRWAVALLCLELVQILVGVVQARLGVPALLVGVHMILACLLAIVATVLVLSLMRPGQKGSSGSTPTATKSTVK